MKIISACLLLFFFVTVQAQKDSCCKLVDSIEKNTHLDTCCCCRDDNTIKCFNPSKNDSVKLLTVLYDFKTKNIAYPKGYKDLKRSQAIRIKVVNFNPFIYKINIDNHDSTHKASVDAGNILAAFTSLSNLPSLVSGIANAVITSPVTKSTDSKTMEIIDHLLQTNNLLSANLTGLGRVPLTSQTPPKTLHSDNTIKKDSTAEQKRELTLGTFYTNQKLRIKVYTHHLFNKKDSVDEKIYQWSRLFAPERNPYPSCTDFLHLTSGSDITAIEVAFHDIKNNIRLFSMDIENEHQNYLDTIAMFDDVFKSSANTSIKILDSLIRTYYTQVSTQLSKIDSLLNYQSLQQLVESLDRIKNMQPCYTSPPLFLLSDSKVVTLQIKPWKDTIPYQTDAPITFELPWQQKHIWGVSAGIYGSGLHNNSYSTKTLVNGTDTTYTLVKDNAGKAEFGINALAYTGSRIKESDWFFGCAFGAGFSIESKPKPRIFTGISFINGDKNRIAFSGGLTAGFVQRLSAAYLNLNTPSHVFPTVVTKDAIRLSGFLSINYSFLGN